MRIIVNKNLSKQPSLAWCLVQSRANPKANLAGCDISVITPE